VPSASGLLADGIAETLVSVPLEVRVLVRHARPSDQRRAGAMFMAEFRQHLRSVDAEWPKAARGWRWRRCRAALIRDFLRVHPRSPSPGIPRLTKESRFDAFRTTTHGGMGRTARRAPNGTGPRSYLSRPLRPAFRNGHSDVTSADCYRRSAHTTVSWTRRPTWPLAHRLIPGLVAILTRAVRSTSSTTNSSGTYHAL
jgi:hypothetical protein